MECIMAPQLSPNTTEYLRQQSDLSGTWHFTEETSGSYDAPMGFGVQQDGSIRHCGNALVHMDRLDKMVFDNELRAAAGWPPLHVFTEDEHEEVRRRTEKLEADAAMQHQRYLEVEQRRKRLGLIGKVLSLLLGNLFLVTGIAVGATTVVLMQGTLLQKLAIGFFAFWPGCIPGLFIGPGLSRALKLEE
jgi:hypothetical protein